MVKGTLQSNLIFSATVTLVTVLWLAARGYCNNKMDEDYLLLSNKKNIHFKKLSPESPEIFRNLPFFNSDPKIRVKQSNITCLDFNVQMNSIYYLNDHKEIFIKNPFMDYSEEIIVSNQGHLISFAFDWVAKNLYFIDGYKDSLFVLKIDMLNNKHRKTIKLVPSKVIMELKELREIVVHPNKGYIFVIASLTIYRSDMNGINLINIRRMEFPKSLALDFGMNRLYWCGLLHYKVYHSNLDLTDVKSIQLESNKRPWLLVIHKDRIYISSMNMKKIDILNKLNGVKIKEMPVVYSPDSMKIYSKDIQLIDNTNPCSEGANYNSCDKLCFAIPSNKSNSTSLHALCSCLEGDTIDSDGKTCVDEWNDLYLFVWSCASLCLIFFILIYFIFNFILI